MNCRIESPAFRERRGALCFLKRPSDLKLTEADRLALDVGGRLLVENPDFQVFMEEAF